MTNRKLIIAFFLAALLMLVGCAKEGQGTNKSLFVGMSKERIVVLYDEDGKEIQRWDGMIAIETSKAGCLSFYEGEHHTSIYGGIVVISDKEGGDD